MKKNWGKLFSQHFHHFYREGGCQHWSLQFTITFFTIYAGRGGPMGNSAKFIIFTAFFSESFPNQKCFEKSELFQIPIKFPWKCSVTDLNVCMLRKSNKHHWTCQTVFKYWDHQFTLSSPRLRLLHSSTSFIDTVCILKFPLLFTDLKWIWQEDKWDLNGETSVQKIYYVGEVMSSSRGCNNLEETAFSNQLYCCQTRTKIVALF